MKHSEAKRYFISTTAFTAVTRVQALTHGETYMMTDAKRAVTRELQMKVLISEIDELLVELEAGNFNEARLEMLDVLYCLIAAMYIIDPSLLSMLSPTNHGTVYLNIAKSDAELALPGYLSNVRRLLQSTSEAAIRETLQSSYSVLFSYYDNCIAEAGYDIKQCAINNFSKFDMNTADMVITSKVLLKKGVSTAMTQRTIDGKDVYITTSAVQQQDKNGKVYDDGKYLKSHLYSQLSIDDLSDTL